MRSFSSALELFLTDLAMVSPNASVSPQSRLLDLELDPPAFQRLGYLLRERHGLEAISTSTLCRGPDLTVEEFFRDQFHGAA